MAGLNVQSGSDLAERIQSAAQQKLMDLGWAPEESDTTLSEYVTMMLVNGKDDVSVKAELGGELLGVGEDDPGVADFTKWLFERAQTLGGGEGQSGISGQQEQDMGATTMEPQMQTDDTPAEDAAMGDAGGDDTVPSGPRAMRNGSGESIRGRGRGGRMLGQMNRQMDRAQSDDPLRRIKGAAGAGRIDAHAGRAPRGPRGSNVANGLNRAMNGRGGHQAMAQMNPMMQQNGPVGGLDPNNQMAFMQMMEMQASMMASMLQNGGQLPNMSGGGQRGRGGKSLFDRMDNKRGGRGGRQQSHASNGDAASAGGMDLDKPLTDTTHKAPFDTMCKFNLFCTNPDCHFAHQSPANRRPNVTVDMSDTCSFGAACTNNKCVARHVSPAKRGNFDKSEVMCRFYPNCTAGSSCPFKHPDTQACRNGADCKVDGCTYAHSAIMCRYNPCTRPDCPYKHAEGQKGIFNDKVWTAGGGEPTVEKSDRFAELQSTGGQEELILPAQQNGDGAIPADGVSATL